MGRHAARGTRRGSGRRIWFFPTNAHSPAEALAVSDVSTAPCRADRMEGRRGVTSLRWLRRRESAALEEELGCAGLFPHRCPPLARGKER